MIISNRVTYNLNETQLDLLEQELPGIKMAFSFLLRKEKLKLDIVFLIISISIFVIFHLLILKRLNQTHLLEILNQMNLNQIPIPDINPPDINPPDSPISGPISGIYTDDSSTYIIDLREDMTLKPPYKKEYFNAFNNNKDHLFDWSESWIVKMTMNLIT